MRCRHNHFFIAMKCVNEDYDSSEDMEYNTWDSTAEVSLESHSQEGKITVKKVASTISVKLGFLLEFKLLNFKTCSLMDVFINGRNCCQYFFTDFPT